MKRGIGVLDLAVFVEAWLELAWLDLVIRRLPYRYWRHWLDVREKGREPQRPHRVQSLVTAVERAARHHRAPMNCLRRSLALQRLLRRRGIGSRLHLGVRQGAAGLEAHAWVSSRGRVLNDTPDAGQRYAELAAAERETLLARGDGEKAG